MSQSTQSGTVQDVAARLLEKTQANPQNDAENDIDEVEDHDNDNLEDDDHEGVEDDDQPEAGESDDDAEDEEEQDDSTITLEDLEGYDVRIPVTVDGQESEVTLEELRNGYMKDSDYRKKTSEIAEQKKALEADREKYRDIQGLQQQYVEQLEILEKVLTKPYSDDQLAKIKQEKGFEAYMEAKDQNDQFAAKVDKIRSEKAKVSSQLTEEQKAELARVIEQERVALVKAVPEIQTDEGEARLFSYLGNQGFTEEQINSTIDHRLFVMAEKARKFDELQKKGAGKPKPRKTKVIKKKASQGKSAASAKKLSEVRKRAQTSGKPNDVAALLLAKRKSKR